MSLNLKSSGGGSVTVDVPSTASNYTATLPAGTGNVVVNGINGALVSGTSVTASGTSVDFTSIPSWVKRITVMFAGVSTNGTSGLLVQIGAGSVTTTGYISTSLLVSNANSTAGLNSTAGFVVYSNSAAYVISGSVVISNISTNTWVSNHTVKNSTTLCSFGGGDIALSGTLDRIRITTVNGTDTFDAGSINIMYE